MPYVWPAIHKSIKIANIGSISNFIIINFYIELKKLKSAADKIVGMTKFFLLFRNITIQINNTKILIINELSERTPEGKIIILPNNAASVE